MARVSILPWRLAAGIISGSAFLVLAGLVRPEWTRAADLTGPDDPALFAAPASAVPPPGVGRAVETTAPIGRIEGRHLVVEILGTPGDSLYLLRDADTDEPISDPMTAAEVTARFPDVAPEVLLTDDGPIMRHVDRHDDLR